MSKMIELCDLSSDDDRFDAVSSSEKTRSSSNVRDSPGQDLYETIKSNPSNIEIFLKEHSERYVPVENRKVNHAKSAPCWTRLTFPIVKDENDRSTIIKNFAACRSSYTTYSYTLGSTRSLNSHKCS